MKAAVWKSLFKYALGVGLLVLVVYLNWSPKLPKPTVQDTAFGAVAGTGVVGDRLLAHQNPGLGEMVRRPIHIAPLLIAAVICGISVLITLVRWHMLVRAQGLPFPMWNALRLGLIGYYLNTFLPGSVGGDILKAYAIASEQKRRTVAVATVLIDRAIGLWALVWFVALSGGIFFLIGDPVLTSNPNLQTLVRWAAYFVLFTVAVWVLLGFLPQRRADRFARRLQWLPKVGHSLAEFWRAVWMYRKQQRAVFLALIMSLVSHTGFVLTFHFSAQTFEAPGSGEIGTLPEHLLIVPVGMTAQALFPTPGGLGGGEAAYGSLYGLIHKPEANGILGCLAQRVVTWGLGVIGYLVYLRMRSSLPVVDTEAAEAEFLEGDAEPPPKVIPEPEPPERDGGSPLASAVPNQ